jgi:hypothetical protein
MKYSPTQCPKCGTNLVKNPNGGRPTRWCSDGCRRSGEDEMARLSTLLRTFTEGGYVERLNGRHEAVRDEVIREMQQRFDHLAGVPNA